MADNVRSLQIISLGAGQNTSARKGETADADFVVRLEGLPVVSAPIPEHLCGHGLSDALEGVGIVQIGSQIAEIHHVVTFVEDEAVPAVRPEQDDLV